MNEPIEDRRLLRATDWLSGLLALLAPWAAGAFTLEVADREGRPVAGFRWLLEEDTTVPIRPGVRSLEIPSLGIHGSYAPVVAKGSSSTATATIAAPASGRYLLSVLPDGGHALGGASVAVGQGSVRVVVQPLPVPTAQIKILVFEDHQPLNAAPDVPAEAGLSGFSILLTDALGQVSQDAFGNPLGTSYARNADGSFASDAAGNPVPAMMGSGVLATDANGEALVSFLAPGKYGVRAVRPLGSDWIQTSSNCGPRAMRRYRARCSRSSSRSCASCCAA